MHSNGPAERTSAKWSKLIACGLVAGIIINAIEWVVHRVWLDARWNAAFAALGKTPSFWGTFVVANFGVGLVSLWTYRWLSSLSGSGRTTALKTAGAMWIIFWVIPIMGMQPFDIFPDYLLALVIVAGIADVALGVLPALGIYDRWK